MKSTTLQVTRKAGYVATKSTNYSASRVIASLKQAVIESRPVTLLAQICCCILGEEVETAKVLRALHAILAVMAAVFFGGYSATIQILLIVWAALAVWQCKRDGWSED